LLKETEAAENVHADTVIDDRLEGAVDADVARIINGNLMNSDGLDTAETILGASTGSTDQARELEV
jgi:hypothetical protein